MRPIYTSVDGYQYLAYENDTISHWLESTGRWENDLILHAETYLKDDSVILDIGANIGT